MANVVFALVFQLEAADFLATIYSRLHLSKSLLLI